MVFQNFQMWGWGDWKRAKNFKYTSEITVSIDYYKTKTEQVYLIFNLD